MSVHRGGEGVLTFGDVVHFRRFIADQKQIEALEKLLIYAADEAAGVGLAGCERQLLSALAELRKETGWNENMPSL